MGRLYRLFVRSVILTAGCVLIGVIFNALRPSGIDLVAQAEYQIYVPCPESLAEADSVTAEQVRTKAKVLYVDARPLVDFEKAHITEAISFPYPLLGDPEPAKVEDLKRRSIPIVIYGDGGRGRLGEMMAKLLTELGVEEVTHLEGGIKSWREQGGEIEGPEEAQDE